MPGRLTLCSTPIGNLGDAAPRLGEALAAADVVYAEDTRRTRTLLDHFGVTVEVRSYYVGNESSRAGELADRLVAGEEVVLVTDAGTPAIADPGVSAVRAATDAGAEISIVPGPSAVTAALAVSGLPAERFVFEGFLPRKHGERKRHLAELATEERTIVLFSARSRVAADLEAMAAAFGGDRPIVVARELTKAHEEIFRGSLADAASRWGSDVEPRGEFTLVVAGAEAAPVAIDRLLRAVDDEVASGATLSDAVRAVAEASGTSRRELYEAALRARDGA